MGHSPSWRRFLLHYFQMYDKIDKIIKGRLSYLIVKVECYEKKKVFKYCYYYPEFLYLTKKSIICKTSDMGDCDRRFLLLTQNSI